MQSRTRLGYLLLLFPLLIWIIVLAMRMNANFNQGILGLLPSQIFITVYFTAGFVFPLIAIVLSAFGYREEETRKESVWLMLSGSAFLLLLILTTFVF